MTKLEKLYSIIENSRDVGVKLTDDVLRQVEELEENIIKEEILPALSSDIAPRLKSIKRDLVLVVEYHPGEPISVALSRKARISEILGAKPLTPRDNTSASHTRVATDKPKQKRSPKTGLCVYLPDGSFIQEKQAALTMQAAIVEAGVERVFNLRIPHDGDVLVSRTEHKAYKREQKPLAGGYLLNTHSSTATKQKQLQRIATALHLRWKVEIIK